MATIITLHGTNASGPEEGDRWWQRGSACETDLRRFVEAEDGTLTYAPLVWTGLNSEGARREAAEKLVQRMSGLEAQGERYCVIGHSHGGSVISHALLIAANRKLALPGMSRWITVGTPFIEPQKAWLLFSRLGVLGRSAYLTFLVLVFMLAVPALFMGWGGAILFSKEHPISVLIGTMIPLIIIYAGMLYLNVRKLHHYRPTNLKRARELFEDRWRAFWHPNDEAICGLRSMRDLNLAIFDSQFAVPIITALTLFALPLGLMAFVLFNHEAVLGSGAGSAIGGSVGGIPQPDWTIKRVTNGAVAWAIITTIVGAVLYFVSLLITYLSGKLTSLFSGHLSTLLNKAANEQLRGRAYGYDAPGERGLGAQNFPAWLPSSQPSLPEDLASEVGALSDNAAATSLIKFRSALSDLTFAKPGDRSLSLDAYLCWDELIHTAYFSVPRFRKLVAWEVASSPGFRPAPALASDPDNSLLQSWSTKKQKRTSGEAQPAAPELQVVPAPA
jgi:hypothetical protein